MYLYLRTKNVEGEILIIDDNPSACQRLQLYLRELGKSDENIQIAPNASEALVITSQLNPELVFLDIELPEYDGFQLWERMKDQGFNGKVICTTLYDNYILKALRNNAFDYLLKPLRKNELAEALERFESNSNIHELDFNKLEDYGLTERQMEICKRLLYGQSTREIAEELFLSEHTVYTHRKNILRSTGCKSATEIFGLL